MRRAGKRHWTPPIILCHSFGSRPAHPLFLMAVLRTSIDVGKVLLPPHWPVTGVDCHQGGNSEVGVGLEWGENDLTVLP